MQVQNPSSRESLRGVDLLIAEDWLESQGSFELPVGPLRTRLELIGVLDPADAGVLQPRRLERLLALVKEAPQDRAAALTLPPSSPLRRFYEHVLCGEQDEPLLRVLTQGKVGHRELPVHALPTGEQLYARLLNCRADGLGQPGYRRPPAERIVWGLLMDLGAGLKLHGEEARRRAAYQALLMGAEAQAALLVDPTSLPAMKAWLTRKQGQIPPALPGELRLHIGTKKVRIELFATAPAEFVQAFSERFINANQRSGCVFEVNVSATNRDKKSFSASKTLVCPEGVSKSFDVIAKFVDTHWKQLLAIIQSTDNEPNGVVPASEADQTKTEK